MKKWLLLFAVMMGAGSAHANFDSRVAISRGSYIDIASINPSSFTGTAVFSPDSKRIDGILFNNSANVVWLGTTSATQDMIQHSNITNGIPVLASTTFRLDGLMSGPVYATCGVAVAACNVRVLTGKIQ